MARPGRRGVLSRGTGVTPVKIMGKDAHAAHAGPETHKPRASLPLTECEKLFRAD